MIYDRKRREVEDSYMWSETEDSDSSKGLAGLSEGVATQC